MAPEINFSWDINLEPIKLGSLIMFRKAIENHIEFSEVGRPILYFSKNNHFSEKYIKLIKNIFEDTNYSLNFTVDPETKIINPWDGKMNYYSTWHGIDHQISQNKGRQELLWGRKNQSELIKATTCHLRIKQNNEPLQIYHSRIGNWVEFFKIKKEQKFLLLGDEPYPSEMLQLDNVIKACGNLNNQLSLIDMTKGFIGCASGFSAVAVLSTKPAFVFKHPDHHPEEFISPRFLGENQMQVRQADTLQNIINGAKLCKI